MKALVMGAALIAAGTCSAAAAASEQVVFVETRAMPDKPAVTLNPDKAYIFVRTDGYVSLHLMRVPSAEDQVKYDEMKAEALAEAREKYTKKKARYDADKLAYDKAPKGARKLPLPEKPVEPTAENFEFVPFGLMAGVAIGPLYRFSKSKEQSVYLQEVTPGTYRIYRNSMLTCLCMGSVQFSVKAGEITDLGTFDNSHVKEVYAARNKGDSAQPLALAPRYLPAAPGAPTDPRLTAMSSVPAVLKPVGKLPNYFGATVDRFPAIEGVMRYDRDRIVDLTVGN